MAIMPRSPRDPDTDICRARGQGRLCARWRRTYARVGRLYIDEAPETPSLTIGIKGRDPRRRIRKVAVSPRSRVPSFQCGSLLTGEDQNSSEPPGVPLVSLEAVPSSMI